MDERLFDLDDELFLPVPRTGSAPRTPTSTASPTSATWWRAWAGAGCSSARPPDATRGPSRPGINYPRPERRGGVAAAAVDTGRP
jgi:hypothetical protein